MEILNFDYPPSPLCPKFPFNFSLQLCLSSSNNLQRRILNLEILIRVLHELKMGSFHQIPVTIFIEGSKILISAFSLLQGNRKSRWDRFGMNEFKRFSEGALQILKDGEKNFQVDNKKDSCVSRIIHGGQTRSTLWSISLPPPPFLKDLDFWLENFELLLYFFVAQLKPFSSFSIFSYSRKP